MEVKTNTLPAVLVTLLGYAGAMLAGWLVQKGIITGDDTQKVVGGIMALGATGYGAYKTWHNRTKIVDAALTPPSEVKFK